MEPQLTLDTVLSLRPDLRAERLAADLALIIGERARFALSSPKALALLALVDGQRTVDQILGAARGQVAEPDAFFLLQELCQSGALVPATHGLAPETAAFWYGVGLDAASAAAALSRTPLDVHAIGSARGAGALRVALALAGAEVVEGAAAHVVVTDDLLDLRLHEVQADLWCPVKLVGVVPLVGPLLRRGAGPCWACVAHWLRQNRPVEALVQRQPPERPWPELPIACSDASLRAASGLAALAITRALAGASDGTLDAQVLALELGGLQITRHAVPRRPQCPRCGDPRWMRRQGERPIELQPVARPHRHDGGFRSQSARETYARYRHLVSPITGAVTHLAPMPGRHTELRAVYASGFLATPRDGVIRGDSFDKLCAGKGRTEDQARVSALCEALERYSCLYQGDEARVRGRADQLDAPAVLPGALLGYSEAQYRERERWNARLSDHRQWISEPFDPAAPGAVIDWAPAWSLRRNERRYVPLACCYAEVPDESGAAYARAGSNGVAAGNCLEEAILQGLLEVIERDAAGIWWYSRSRRPAWDLESFGDPYFAALRDDYARQGFELWALDLTHDLGVPVCAALAHNKRTGRFTIGFGCHLDEHLAVQRALTEVNQLFEPTGDRAAPWDPRLLPTTDFLFPAPHLRAAHRGARTAIAASTSADLRGDILACVERLSAQGLEVIAMDKTRPDLGLSVARVLVPGLCHFWPRFGPERLYRVPRELGWIDAPLTEAALNPAPLWI